MMQIKRKKYGTLAALFLLASAGFCGAAAGPASAMVPTVETEVIAQSQVPTADIIPIPREAAGKYVKTCTQVSGTSYVWTNNSVRTVRYLCRELDNRPGLQRSPSGAGNGVDA